MQLYNTLTKKKEELVPITPGEIKMYACGPTVYNFFHIGNARAFVVFDALRRYLEYRGYRVTFVQNFTDIDDKMIQKANAEEVTVGELAQRYIDEYFRDADALGISRATHYPRATEHIGEIIALIRTLIDKGHAYAAENGDVYYATKTFEGYGKLSGQPMEELLDGARIAPDDVKREAADFALWKAEKPGEPSWDSPWGKGRPGWHIECSAMSMKFLGETFDIHGGGVDLTFPHHENEIAQSEGATGQPFARCWVHNGYINIDNQKMSKSAGNFFTVRDIAQQYDLEVVRLFLLSAHYRHPVNFSSELMEQSKSALERLRNAKLRLEEAVKRDVPGGVEADFAQRLEQYKAVFIKGMDDDLNTADALGTLYAMVRDINAYFNEERPGQEAELALDVLMELCGVLGLLWRQESIPSEVLALAGQRKQAREARNWALSDALREQIRVLGYAAEDGKEGQVLKKI